MTNNKFAYHYVVDGNKFMAYADAKQHQRKLKAGLPDDTVVTLYKAEWQQDGLNGAWMPMLIPHR